MSKLFIQIMDTNIILSAGSLKGQDEYNFFFKKEIEMDIAKENPDVFGQRVIHEFTLANVFIQGRKKQEIDIIYSKQGILYRIIKVPIMPIDDLEKMMELEKGEFLSVNPDDYEIRFKIIDKYDENGQLFWDIAIAGAEKKDLNLIVDELDKFGFRINFVDILPSNYERIFSKVEEKDLIILEDDGDSSRICILKNGKITLYADFPIDNKEMFISGDYSRLISEVRGYMDYYSSRNFGKNIDALILLRNYNKDIIREEILALVQIKIYKTEEMQNILIKNEEECSQETLVERFYASMSLMNL